MQFNAEPHGACEHVCEHLRMCPSNTEMSLCYLVRRCEASESDFTNRRMVGRELKRWKPSADDAPLEGLEDSHAPRGSSGGSWDQFGVNHRKFGVQTSFQVGLCMSS